MSDAARRGRTQRQRWAAPGGSHDSFVKIAQVVLPTGIGILAAFLVMAPLFMGGDVSFVLDKNKVEVAEERMRIQAARYQGSDSEGKPFVLDAGSAVQKSSAERVVELNRLAAALGMRDGPATLKADRGRYDMEQEQVSMAGPIEFRAADGYALDTRDATIDLKTRQLRSAGPVSGTTPQGTFSGDRLEADLEARTVKMSGNARLRIVPERANRR
ncbi:LPS export ABC transporter periplasmic protein LptC [Sphingomonas sp. S1-29]|uniref:LPS export ABC transporter periplasmic protein LptC n=1 Tax=Sphingomonas sp. S1-29 TaxID=2991074 RepID=UPI00223FEED2|nr:LPS export ABC transporter periplasmic protein LptC [Sphingomonas sp. S1-29]UZK69446.1 LPS export ABC transporter periplasmic protein LptC [Sphingomonas sp. S1-29]